LFLFLISLALFPAGDPGDAVVSPGEEEVTRGSLVGSLLEVSLEERFRGSDFCFESGSVFLLLFVPRLELSEKEGFRKMI